MSEIDKRPRDSSDQSLTPIRRAMTPLNRNEPLRFCGTLTPWPGAYGGDLMVHCASAARHARNLGPLISATFEFLSRADPYQEVVAATEVVRSGRSITHIRVDLSQEKSMKLSAMLVFETQGPAGQIRSAVVPGLAPPQVGPEELTPVQRTDLNGLPRRYREYYGLNRGLDVRYITKPPYTAITTLDASEASRFESQNWTRVREPGDRSSEFSEAAICYISDDAALEPILNAQGISWLDDDADIVTLSHSIRFGRQILPQEWIHSQNHFSLSSGRYMETKGILTNRSGEVVASTQQLGIKIGSR